MAFVNFDLIPLARVLSKFLVVKDFSHYIIWRRMAASSFDGGKALKTFLTFVNILIASSRVTGIILPISRRRFFTTESEDIYHWPHVGW